jgi:hypothetical protein
VAGGRGSNTDTEASNAVTWRQLHPGNRDPWGATPGKLQGASVVQGPQFDPNKIKITIKMGSWGLENNQLLEAAVNLLSNYETVRQVSPSLPKRVDHAGTALPCTVGGCDGMQQGVGPTLYETRGNWRLSTSGRDLVSRDNISFSPPLV